MGKALLFAISILIITVCLIKAATSNEQVWMPSTVEGTKISYTTDAPEILHISLSPELEEPITDEEVQSVVEAVTSMDKTDPSSDVVLSAKIAPSISSEVNLIDHVTTSKPKIRCSMSSVSYKQFNFENIPSEAPHCSYVERSLSDEHSQGELRFIQCLNHCTYYAGRITDFSYDFSPDAWMRLRRAKTLIVRPESLCEGESIPTSVQNLTWGKARWLQVEFQNPNECSVFYEMLRSWKLPKVTLLSFDRPYFSVTNQENMEGLLRKVSPHLQSLRMNQGILCIHCKVFQEDLSWPKLVDADIRWKQNSKGVIQQSEIFVKSTRKLSNLTLGVDLPIQNFIIMSKSLKQLKNGRFGLVIDHFDSNLTYELNLQFLTHEFEQIEKLTFRVSCSHRDDNRNPYSYLHLTQFKNLPPNLNCLVFMIKDNTCKMKVEAQAKEICSTAYHLSLIGRFFKCCVK